MGSYRRWFSFWIRFFVPGGVLFSVGMWGIRNLSSTTLSSSVLTTAWVITACSGLLLAWRFHRDSAFFSILVLTGAWLVVNVVPNFRDIRALPGISELLACLVTIDVVLFFTFRDRGLFSIYGAVRALFVAVQGVAFLLLLKSGGIKWIRALHFHLLENMGISKRGAAICLAIGLLMLFYKFLKTRSPLSAGGFWGVTAGFLMITSVHTRFGTTFWAIVAVAIFLVAIVEQSFQLAYHDELTGLAGRRALNEFLASTSGSLTALMVDIDYFKRFNDRYGHDVGDQVLKLVASRLGGVRGGKAYRYGGEEFVIVFPGKSLEHVLPRAEALRKSVKESEFVLRHPWKRRKAGPKKRKSGDVSGKRLSVTVSIGIAETNRKNQTPDAVIKAADKALYRAKRSGRNRVSR